MKKILFTCIIVVAAINAYCQATMGSKDSTSSYMTSLQAYNKYLETHTDDVVAYKNRGIIKNKLKDYTGAIADFDRALQMIPTNDSVYYYRGNTKADMGNYKGAVADFLVIRKPVSPTIV